MDLGGCQGYRTPGLLQYPVSGICLYIGLGFHATSANSFCIMSINKGLFSSRIYRHLGTERVHLVADAPFQSNVPFTTLDNVCMNHRDQRFFSF